MEAMAGDRSIFTIEEDPNSPNDLQIVSKRYIRGKDEVREIGHDQPMTSNYDEDVEAESEEDVAESAGESVEDNYDVQADPQEILWTKPYQGSVHEGVQPESDRAVYDGVAGAKDGRRFFDMLSGADLGDDFMKDDTVEEGENVVRTDSGLGADTYDEPLVAEDTAQDAVPWIPIRKSWFSEFPLSMKVIKRIAKEEKLDPKHFEPDKDIRQRLLQKVQMHAFSNGQKAPGFLVLIEARTNCLRKPNPGGMGQSTVPPPQRNIYPEAQYVGETVIPPQERDVLRSDFLGVAYPPPPATPPPPKYYSYPIPPAFQYGMPPVAYADDMPVVLSAKELEYGLGRIHLTNLLFKDRAKKKVNAITIMSRLPLDTNLGELSLQLTPFTPPPFTPFKNVENFIRNPPPTPLFKNLATMMNTPAPTPPAFDLSIDFKTFELSKDVQDRVKKAQDAITAAVTVWTNKSPPYQYQWKEVLSPGQTYTVTDKNVVTALVNAIAKSRSLYKYKTFSITDTGTWEPNITRMFKGLNANEDIMGGMVKNFVDGITSGMGSFKDATSTIWDVIKGLPKSVIDNLKTNMDLVKAKGAAFGTNLKDYGLALKNHVMDIIEAVKMDIGEVKDFILSWVKGLTQAIMADATELQSYVINLFNSFSAWVKTNITTLVGNIKTEIGKVVASAAAEARKIVADVEATVKGMVENVKTEMLATYNKLKTEFTTTVNQVKATFQANYDKLMGSLTQTVEIVKKQGEILTENIKKVANVQAAYEKFVQDTGQRFQGIEERLAAATGKAVASSEEKKGLFASLFSGIRKKVKHRHGIGQTYPPAGSPPVVQYPYAYPGAPRVFGTQVPWYDNPYTEVDMPAIDFEREPAPQAVSGYRPEIAGFV